MDPSSLDNYKFYNRIETTIHETVHVLGFSSFAIKYWVDPETGNYYTEANTSKITKIITIRDIPTSILFSKNILATARKYYGCSTMEGM